LTTNSCIYNKIAFRLCKQKDTNERDRKSSQQGGKAITIIVIITTIIIIDLVRNVLNERRFVFTYHLQLSDVLLPPKVVLVFWPHGSDEVIRVHDCVDNAVHISQEDSMATCGIKA
jgi:hypothetical protein